MSDRSHDLTVSIDYHQFYLWDAGTDPEAPTDYDEVDTARMVKVAPSVLVVQPPRNGDVDVRVTVREAPLEADLEHVDHAVLAAFDLPTGHLQVHECLGGAVLDVELPPGTYQALVRMRGLGEFDDAEHEGDHYQVDLWPGPPHALEVLRQWGR